MQMCQSYVKVRVTPTAKVCVEMFFLELNSNIRVPTFSYPMIDEGLFESLIYKNNCQILKCQL